MALIIRKKRVLRAESAVLETYHFTSRTVQIRQTEDDRVLWTCDCEKFTRQSTLREPVWCKHIAKAAARRSIDRLTRRVAVPPVAATERTFETN